MRKEYLTTDLLIIGGGTAGCYAAVTAARLSPDIRILIAEKANIRRSGCLAAGVNALNAYITRGQTVEDYVEFVRWDAEQIIREDLVRTMAEYFNASAQDLEKMGLVIQKDANGEYAARGKQNIRINGENIKPILAAEVRRHPQIRVLNHVNMTDLLTQDIHSAGKSDFARVPVSAENPVFAGASASTDDPVSAGEPLLQGRDPSHPRSGVRVCGAAGLSIDGETAYAVRARTVLIATGGAAGLYRPNNPGFSRHKMWYPPFNTGAGYAMGIRAGAEMTSFEMRFVAQRCKDTIAPTGTIALGVGAEQINARGDKIDGRYGLTTSGRACSVTSETREGRGPCCLQTVGISPEQDQDLLRAYLNMAPAQTLRWIESGRMPSRQNVEIEGTEPYIVGGHTGSGFWVDAGRRTTLPGLYAAGDAAGGAPKKFVTGAMAEGRIAAQTILADLQDAPAVPDWKIQGSSGAGSSHPELQSGSPDPFCQLDPESDSCTAQGGTEEEETFIQAEKIFSAYARALGREKKQAALYDVFSLEEAMQKVMDEYAGGIRTDYRYSAAHLASADEKIAQLQKLADTLTTEEAGDLYRIYELRDRLTICRTLIAHMQARRETRWPGFGIHTDFPDKDDRFLFFVNSVQTEEGIRILLRPLTPPDGTPCPPDENISRAAAGTEDRKEIQG